MSAAAIPVISAAEDELECFKETAEDRLTVVVSRRYLDDVGAAEASEQARYEGESENIHEVEPSKATNDTFDLAGRPASGLWRSSYDNISS